MNKKKGTEGEQLVDTWMQQQGWRAFISNYYFRGGEIDRVYLGTCFSGRRACVAEIKTVWLENIQKLPELFDEVQMKRFFRVGQMRNLYRFGERLLSPEGWFNCRAHAVHLRVFLVVRFKAQDGLRKAHVPFAPKRLCASGGAHIYALTPEFVRKGQRTSTLQITL